MASMNWKEPETRSKFFLAVLASNETTAVSNAKANSIAQYMGCTPKAVQHQLTSLRKEIEALKSGNFIASASPGGSGSGTPKAKGASSAKKRKAKDDGSEEDKDAGTPSKKARATNKTTTGRNKKEPVSDEEGDDIAARKDAAEGRGGEEGENESGDTAED